jgi:hypothetical protein
MTIHFMEKALSLSKKEAGNQFFNHDLRRLRKI